MLLSILFLKYFFIRGFSKFKPQIIKGKYILRIPGCPPNEMFLFLLWLKVKNLRPEDVALICPQRGLIESEINSNHYSNTPLNAMSRQSQLTLTTPRGRGFLNPIKLQFARSLKQIIIF